MLRRQDIKFFSRKPCDDLHVKINTSNIRRHSCIKYLGVFIDEDMTWKSHINAISSKLSRNIGIIGKSRYFLSTCELLLLYNSLILPYLNYCAVVWGSTYHSKLDKIIKLQKRVIRIVDKKPYLYHTNELFIKHRVLKFLDIVDEQCIYIMLGFLNQSLPAPLSNMFQLYEQGGLRVRQHFQIPFSDINYRMFSLPFIAPKAWNKIICSHFHRIDDVPRSKMILKKHIRQYIIRKYELFQ